MESFLGTTLGALLIGGLGTAILYGCTNIQIYVYFSNYRQDRLILKSTVVFLWIVDSFHMVFTIIILWHYLIESFGDYLALLTTPWSVKVQNSVNVLAILVVQTLYTMRIWTLSSNLDHKCWARVLSVVLVAGYISGIILVVEIWRTIEYTEVAQYRWAIYLSLSMSTFNDFMIAAAICHLLATCGSTLSEMKSKVWIIMRYAVISGTLTSFFSLSALISFYIMPSNLIYLAQIFLISKLYINSYLAMLNARNSLRECGLLNLSRMEACVVDPRRSEHVIPVTDMEMKRTTLVVDSHSMSSEESDSVHFIRTVAR